MDIVMLPLGETVLTSVGANCEAFVVFKDATVQYALLESGRQGMRYIINGEQHPWHEEVSRLTFLPFPGYFYNYKDGKRRSYNFKGADNPAQNLVAYDVTQGGKAICVERRGKGDFSTYIGGVETPYNLEGELTLTHDNKGFIYQAVDNHTNRKYCVVLNGKVIFESYAGAIRISDDRTRYSWVGADNKDDCSYPYLNSRKVDRRIEYYEPDSFTPSDDCARYLFCERDGFDDEGPAFLVVDGERTNVLCDECHDGEFAMFNDDGSSYCFACTNKEKTIVVLNGETIAQHDEVFDSMLIGDGLFYVGCDIEEEKCTVYKNLSELSTWPYIEKYTCVYGYNGEHYCFFANEYGLQSDDSRWWFVVDGEPVWTFDDIPRRDCGYFHPEIYPIQIIGDSVYCAAVKNSNLVIYHHKLASG